MLCGILFQLVLSIEYSIFLVSIFVSFAPPGEEGEIKKTSTVSVLQNFCTSKGLDL